MQGEIIKNWRIVAATLFSVVLVISAYVLAHGFESPQIAQASAETALLKAIATKDSSGDGLPDWEKALYGIPVNATTTDYFNLGMTDGEAVARGLIVPKAIADIQMATSTSVTNSTIDYAAEGLSAPTEGSLTDAFAKSVFTLYVAAKQNNGGVELSSSQIQDLETQAISSLTTSITAAPDFKSTQDINVSGSGPDALRAFAVAAEAVLKKNASDATKSDLQYLQDAIENKDTSAPAHLASMAKSYRDSAIGLATLPVPKELAIDDLAIVNSLMRLSEIYSDFARVNTDSLAAMLALEQYTQTELNAEHAFTTLFNIYITAGVSMKNGTPGAAFVNIMPNLGAQQAVSSTKNP
jgi:hypothetical protein